MNSHEFQLRVILHSNTFNGISFDLIIHSLHFKHIFITVFCYNISLDFFK